MGETGKWVARSEGQSRKERRKAKSKKKGGWGRSTRRDPQAEQHITTKPVGP